MKKLIIIFVSILFLFSACDYSFFDGKIETEGTITPTYAVPLIDASFTLEELLPDDNDLNRYLLIDDTGFMTLLYKKNLFDISPPDFFGNYPLAGLNLPYIEYTEDAQTFDLNLNLNLNGGTVVFFDPKLKIIITNYWGIPSKISFKDMYYTPDVEATPLPITGSFVTDTFLLDYPTGTEQYVIDTLEMNVNNSNIDEILESLPYSLTAGASIETIPGGTYDVRGANNNNVGLEIEIPLNLSMDNISFTDTLNFDLGVNPDSTKVKSLTLNFIADNGFPLGLKSQIYFLDENFNIVDSVFNTRLDVTPASVSNGLVDARIETKNTTTISENSMDHILEAKYLLMDIRLRTTDAANLLPVMIFADYDIKIRLSAKMDLELIL